MKFAYLFVAAAFSLSSWSAAAATRTVTFTNAGPFGAESWTEDGVTVSGTPYTFVGPHIDDGYSPTGFTEFLLLSTGQRFDAVGLDIAGLGTNYYVFTPDCFLETCRRTYDNVLIAGWRADGSYATSTTFYAGDFANGGPVFRNHVLGAAFRDLDFLRISALLPAQLGPDMACMDNVCSHFLVDNIVLRDTVAPAVPEPSTWAMMIVGLGGVALAARRRRRPPAAQGAV